MQASRLSAARRARKNVELPLEQDCDDTTLRVAVALLLAGASCRMAASPACMELSSSSEGR